MKRACNRAHAKAVLRDERRPKVGVRELKLRTRPAKQFHLPGDWYRRSNDRRYRSNYCGIDGIHGGWQFIATIAET
jgi:hypothetical protein